MRRLAIAAGMLFLVLILGTAVNAAPGLGALRSAVLRLLVTEAPQDGEAPQLPTDATPVIAVGGPTNLGQMSLAQVAHASTTDVLLPGTWSAFAFTRRYTSNAREETNQAFDFGDQIIFNVTSAPGRPFGPRNWTHNLYAYAQYTSFARTWQVRAGGGAVLLYGGLTSPQPNPWIPMNALSTGDARFDGTRLLIPGDGVYHFERPLNVSTGYIRLLTRIEDSERNADGTARYRAILDYTPPPAGECSGYTSANNPYVTKVTNGEGFILQLHYKTLSTTALCVLAWVSVTPPGTGGTESKRVSYDYLEQTSPSRIKLSGIHYYQPDGTDAGIQTYGYNPAGNRLWHFIETTNGVESRRINLAQFDGGTYDGVVLTQTFGFPADVVWGISDGGYPAISYSLPVNDVFTPPINITVQEESVPRGDGTSSTVTIRRTLEYYGLQGYVTRGQGDFCVGPCSGIPAPGPREWGWSDGGVYGNVPTAYRDARGNLTVYTWNTPDAGIQALYSQQGQRAPMALTSITEGASDVSGASGLLKTNYDYLYSTTPVTVDGGTVQTLHRTVQRVVQPSVLMAGQQASTLSVRDSQSNRIKAVIRSGWTQDVNGNVLPSKTYVGTFYFAAYQCAPPPAGLHGAQAGTAGEDALGRPVEIHGPCFVDSETATDCRSADVNMPLTQVTYWPAGDSNAFRRNRVAQVATSARNSGRSQCGSAASNNLLVSEITGYDERGHATDAFGPSGVETKATYKGDLLDTTQLYISSTVSLTTTQGYDSGRLAWVRHPSGVYDVYCYRYPTSGGCVGGALTDKLQWKATSATSDGASWTEKVVFNYVHGRLASEKYFDSAGTIRRTVVHQSDPFGRPTWEAAGTVGAPATVYTTAGFDGNGNRIGIGYAINNARSFCALGGGSGCSVLSFDALNRFTSLLELGATAAFQVTYDPGQGYPKSATLATDNPNGGRAQYTYDDFGNVVRIDGSWMNNSESLGGHATYTYDAAGRLVTKVSATMKGSGACLRHSYDALGRELSKEYRTNCSQPASSPLYAFAYDSSVTPPAGCAGAAGAPASNSKGRLQRKIDSFGQTWFAYDAAGNLVAEQRIRSGDTQCQPLPANFTSFPTPGFPSCMPTNLSSTTNSNKRLNTLYQYDSIARLTGVQYPHGRIIRYGYGTAANLEKITVISADLLRGSGCSTQVLIDNIQWEPFGGLRAYHAVAPLASAPNSPDFSVEYLLGSPDASTNPVPQSCNQTRPSTLDETGRYRALWVSTGSAIGSGTGNIFKQTYSWRGTQLREQSTCLLATAGAARVESYGYDTRLRLTSAFRPSTAGYKQKDTGGALGKRGYTYDGLGNRLTEQSDCWAFSAGYGGSPARPEWLTSYSSTTPTPPSSCSAVPALAACQGSPYVSTSFAYDANGRVTQKRMPASATLPQQWAVSFDYTTDATQAAEGGVYKAATVNGAPYQYFYDATGRRRFKSYPSAPGMGDEFFYVGGDMVEDVGISTVSGAPNPASPPIDEYVWLGGRPVLVLKGAFASWVRQRDDVGTVTRNDRAANPGPHQLITDYLGKPVLLLDPWGRVAGAADYDPFGNVNKATLIGETAHPYGISAGKILAQLAQPPTPTGSGAALVLDLRVRFALVDSASSSDYAVVTTPDVNERFAIDGSSTKLFGTVTGRPFSKWVRVPSDGKLQVRYYSGLGSSTFKGFAVEGYEYRRYQSSVTPVAVTPTWVPFRLPGQYFDEETALFQNNARFYDPQVGRFLQPDAAWYSPSALIAAGAAGGTTPVYAYASNEPLTTSDPTGNVAIDCNGFANCGTMLGGGPGLSNGQPGTKMGFGEHVIKQGQDSNGKEFYLHNYYDPSFKTTLEGGMWSLADLGNNIDNYMHAQQVDYRFFGGTGGDFSMVKVPFSIPQYPTAQFQWRTCPDCPLTASITAQVGDTAGTGANILQYSLDIWRSLTLTESREAKGGNAGLAQGGSLTFDVTLGHPSGDARQFSISRGLLVISGTSTATSSQISVGVGFTIGPSLPAAFNTTQDTRRWFAPTGTPLP
jgi:RHS repeat-associated protein